MYYCVYMYNYTTYISGCIHHILYHCYGLHLQIMCISIPHRELNAIDSEHAKNINDDGFRLYQVSYNINNNTAYICASSVCISVRSIYSITVYSMI